MIKHGSSACIGIGLEVMLRDAGFDQLVLCGGAANYCVESMVRIAGNLGFDTRVVGDALINFQKTLRDGRVLPAADVLAVVLANLDGEFARVVSSDEILAELTVGRRSGLCWRRVGEEWPCARGGRDRAWANLERVRR